MKKYLVAIFFLLLVVKLSPGVQAQYGQYGQPSPSLSIVMNKLVAHPVVTKGGVATCDGANYVDNYSPSDARFAPSGFVCFALRVKNTSSVTLYGVTVKDYLPAYVKAVEGPGSYDVNTRTITVSAGDFSANEEKTYTLKAQIDNQNQLPADKGLMCLVNKAQAYNDTVSDDDSAQFCVEKQVGPVSKAPAAGPEMGVVLLGINAAALSIGLFLKKRSSK